jgi:hypothetical protein
MSLTEEHKIRIHFVTGGPDKDELKDCYFSPTAPGEYVFYSSRSDSAPLAQKIHNHGAFTFSLDGLSWVIPDPSNPSHPLEFHGSGRHATAKGSWLNNNLRDPADDPTGESGTFQAQAGSGAGNEEDATSAAKA